MAQNIKTIKVDETIHNELERLKRKYEVETFNDVLRKELGIVPSPETDELAAYLPKELRSTAEEMLKSIEKITDLEKKVEEKEGKNYLIFTTPEFGRDIVEIEFDEEWFKIYYRNHRGMMSLCGTGQKKENEIYYTSAEGDEISVEEFKRVVESKVRGACRRWK